MDSNNIVMIGKQQVELRQEEVSPLPEDSLLVRTRMSLISTGTECICYRGDLEEGTHWAGWVKYPFYPGYSNVGTVERVGEAVEGYEVGDRVFSTASHRQFHIVEPPVNKIPDYIADKSAIWSKLGTIAQTGVRRARLELGDRVVIIGLGPLGQLLTQYTRVMGAGEVLAVDPVESRLAVAAAHGATQTFAGTAADALPFVADHTGGRLADVVFDATGHYAVFPLALKLVRNFGTLMLIGDSPHPGKQVLTADIVTRQITVCGSHNERLPDERVWTMQQQIELLYTYLSRNQMRVDDLITKLHAPGEAPGVYTELFVNRSETIGVGFDWSLN
ncbi:MAG: zinc-binding dehydrogenase [Truepera sp.]|nr:zinc-binding dehydrogenase [Truepera sp.]